MVYGIFLSIYCFPHERATTMIALLCFTPSCLLNVDHFKYCNDTYGHAAVTDYKTWIDFADQAMYAAKDRGRNTVVFYQPKYNVQA